MGIKAQFNRSDIKKFYDEYRQQAKDAILNELTYIGLEFVRNARSKTKSQGGFGDITGNLRSSIGFVVLDHGKTHHENYETVKDGADGLEKAKKYTAELTAGLPNNYTYALICVAGMDYAKYVEDKGRDVITGSSLIAEQELRKYFK